MELVRNDNAFVLTGRNANDHITRAEERRRHCSIACSICERDAKLIAERVALKEVNMAAISNTKRKRMPAQRFAFPKERKEPLNDANHVRNAIARFNQVEGVSEAERDAAWRRIKAAAKRFGVDVETSKPGHT